MMAGTQGVEYHSYIVRLWRDGGAEAGTRAPWRISLEDPQSAQRIGFRSVAELAAYLTRQTSDPPPQTDVEPDDDRHAPF